MRRFFVNAPLSPVLTIVGEDVHHISRVLRLKTGTTVIVVDPGGQAGEAIITEITADSVVLALQTRLSEQQEAPIQVFLAQGLPKGDKMDYIIQKAVELGVAEIFPLAMEHSVVQYTAVKAKARVERWQKIATEAAKQCGRSVIPVVNSIQSLPDMLEQAQDMTIIMLYEGDAPVGLKATLATCLAHNYLLLIGPEGGFSKSEVILAKQRGARLATMGPRILRTETAAVAALSVVMYEYGDLGGS